MNAVRGLLDQAQVALLNTRLSADWRHAIELAVGSLRTTLTSAVSAATRDGGDSGDVPAQVADGVSEKVSETMRPGVEVFGRRFDEVWDTSQYDGLTNQYYRKISDSEQYINTPGILFYVRSNTLSSEISDLYRALTKHVSDFTTPLTFEFDENGQHFEARVGRDYDNRMLFIRLAAQFPRDNQRYCSYIYLREASWTDPSVGPKVIPGYEQGKYCVFSQTLSKLSSKEGHLWDSDSSYSPASDFDFQKKMALFKPVSLDLIFRLIREHVKM